MSVLTVAYEWFQKNPGYLFGQMRERGCDGCVIYQGRKYIVRLVVEDAANDSVYDSEKNQGA